MRKRKLIILIIFLFLIFSCKTYTISVDSFSEQMKKPDTEKLQEVKINNPIHTYKNIKYEANSIKFIVVIDKEGNKLKLKNSPKLEMRITRKNGNRNILLFDTVVIENDTLKGARSRLLQNLRKEVPLGDIEKIEIQNSGKAYKYQ